jgi:hypothetical protein
LDRGGGNVHLLHITFSLQISILKNDGNVAPDRAAVASDVNSVVANFATHLRTHGARGKLAAGGGFIAYNPAHEHLHPARPA